MVQAPGTSLQHIRTRSPSAVGGRFLRHLALVEEPIGAIRWRHAALALCRSSRIGGDVVYERAVAASDHPGWDHARDLGGHTDHRRLAYDCDGADVIPGR